MHRLLSFYPVDLKIGVFHLHFEQNRVVGRRIVLFCAIFLCGYLRAVFGVIYPIKPINGPRQAYLVLIAYASSEGSGEPAHPRSLARTFAARSYKQWVKRNLQTESQIPSPSEWLGMRS